MLKWIVRIVIALVVLVVILGAVGAAGVAMVANQEGGMARFGGGGPEATEVRIASPTVGVLERVVSAPGAIEPLTKVEISAQVSARIVALPYREGSFVEEGEVVVELDARDLEAALRSSEASLRSEEARLDGAKADFIRTRTDFGRAKELAETGDIPQSEADLAEADFLRSQSELKRAEQAIEIAKANIERAQKDLDNAIIRAPISGTVTVLNAEVGETVVVGTLNTPGSIIMEVADLSTMIVRTQIDQTNIAPIEPGQKARVYVNAFPDKEFSGEVRRVALKMSQTSDGVGFFDTEVVMELGETERIYSGLSASVDVIVETFQEALKVPSQAVLDRRVDELPRDVVEGNDLVDERKTFARVVYRMVDGEAVATPVVVGPSDLTETLIEAGLGEDDVVVVGPFRVLVNIKHEQKIKEEGGGDEQDESEDESDGGSDGDDDPAGDGETEASSE